MFVGVKVIASDFIYQCSEKTKVRQELKHGVVTGEIHCTSTVSP